MRAKISDGDDIFSRPCGADEKISLTPHNRERTRHPRRVTDIEKLALQKQTRTMLV